MNIDQIMKAAKSMQESMQNAQQALEEQEVEGQSGGGLVKITANAQGKVLRVAIDDSLMKVEEREMLEDLIVAAFNDAKLRAEEVAQKTMAEATKGAPIPPGFKLPF